MRPGLPGPWPWAHHSFSPQPQKGRYLLPTRKTSGQVYVVFKIFNIVKVAKMVTKINIKTGETGGGGGKERGEEREGKNGVETKKADIYYSCGMWHCSAAATMPS